MPRFVVLTHDHPFLHWDLMLEKGSVLQTWRLLWPPDVEGPIEAEALGNHRLAYLDYEGPVSGGRGTVQRWDTGTHEILESNSDRIAVRFAGQKISGEAWLARTQDGAGWVFRRGAWPSEGS